MKMHSKTKNIKRENHEIPGKISWIESMSASSIFHLLTEVILKFRFSKKTTKKLTKSPSYLL